MKTSPRVTVLMTSWNGAPYVGETVKSVLGQSFDDFKLVIVDDCSTDETRDVLDGFDDPRIARVNRTRNGGVVAARNEAVTHAVGDFVATIDHDDLWRADKLARQVACLDFDPTAVAVTTAGDDLIDGVSYPARRATTDDPVLLDFLLHLGNPLVYSGLMVRRSALTELGEFMRQDWVYADDYDLYHRLLRLGPIVPITDALVSYRRVAGSAAKQNWMSMQRHAAGVLTQALSNRGFGPHAGEVATLLVRHVAAGEPPSSISAAKSLFSALDQVAWHVAVRLHSSRMTDARRDFIDAQVALLKRRAVRAAVRQGHLGVLSLSDRRTFVGLWPSLAVGSARAAARAATLIRYRSRRSL